MNENQDNKKQHKERLDENLAQQAHQGDWDFELTNTNLCVSEMVIVKADALNKVFIFRTNNITLSDFQRWKESDGLEVEQITQPKLIERILKGDDING